MPSVSDEEFDVVVEEFISGTLRRFPNVGTSLGLHEWDVLVPDLSREGMESAITFYEGLLKRLESIDLSRLSKERAVDYVVLRNQVKSYLIQLRDWPTWRYYPVGFEYLGELIFPLLINERLPEEHRALAIYRRLEDVDRYLTASIKAVDEPYKLWVGYSYLVAKSLPDLLGIVRELGRKWGREELTEVANEVQDLISKSLSKLEDLMIRGMPGYKPLGRELFVELLECKFIRETPEELKKWGYEEAERYREKILRAGEELGVSSVSEALEVMKSARPADLPSFRELYSAIIDRVREFVYEKGVVELPEGESIKIVETPEYLRHIIPFAAYMPPEAFGPSMTGIYFITTPKDPELIKYINFYDILNTAVHEAYPGHHTQFINSKVAKRPLRKFFDTPTLIEGWAHYVEELMLELGIDNSPHFRIKVWHDSLWRAVRVYLDVEIHVEGLEFGKVVGKLVKEAYLPRRAAQGEAIRYTLTPTYQITYSYGKRVIRELKREVERVLGRRITYSEYHRMLLREGNLPVNVLKELILRKLREGE